MKSKNILFAAMLLATSVFTSHVIAEDAKPAAAKEAAKTPAKDYTIAKLGAEEIKVSEVAEILKNFSQNDAMDFNAFDEGMKQNVLRGVISEKLINQEAMKAGFDKRDDIKKRLETLQKQLITQAFIEDKAKTLVTDAEYKTAYDAKVAELKGQEELKARHILVKTEDEAKKIAADLKKGGDFEKTAKEKSSDKASGANGGDLGWFTKDRMVAEFADAAFKLKKGEVSAPVKSGFGWHIIKLEDRRPVKVPSLEEMKPALQGELTNKAVQGYLEGLLKTADIKYLDENGKEKPFARTMEDAAKAQAAAPAPDAKPVDAVPAAGKAEDKKDEKKQ